MKNNTLIRMARALRPAMLVGAVLLTATLVVPGPVEAQGFCFECMVTGEEELGRGQPGGGIDCVDQPEGMTSCFVGSYESVQWCETSGSMCQELMFLDFYEDGSAHQRPDMNPVRRPYAVLEEEVRRTCDGVLLRTLDVAALRDDRRHSAAALLL